MRDFLQRDVGVTCPVVGTIVGCSPMGVQKEMDAIDTHAYWRHPKFPGGEWDEEDWTVPARQHGELLRVVRHTRADAEAGAV